MYYTYTKYTVRAGVATALVGRNSAGDTISVAAVWGVFIVEFTTPGAWVLQVYDAGGVVDTFTWQVAWDIQHAPEGYDPRTPAEKTLEALEAKIAGRVLTMEMASVTVDGRSITYINDLNTLLKWRNYYRALVAREQGHAMPNAELFVIRRH